MARKNEETVRNENLVTQHVNQYLEGYFGKNIPDIDMKITFRNGTPRALGKTKIFYNSARNKTRFEFVFYRDYMKQGINVYCRTTVAHEVCHLITRLLYGRVKPHGVEFRKVCGAFNTGYKIDSPVSPISYERKNGNSFKYKCENCGEIIYLSKIRHNRVIENGGVYLHSPCGRAGKLVYVGDNYGK